MFEFVCVRACLCVYVCVCVGCVAGVLACAFCLCVHLLGCVLFVVVRASVVCDCVRLCL